MVRVLACYGGEIACLWWCKSVLSFLGGPKGSVYGGVIACFDGGVEFDSTAIDG